MPSVDRTTYADPALSLLPAPMNLPFAKVSEFKSSRKSGFGQTFRNVQFVKPGEGADTTAPASPTATIFPFPSAIARNALPMLPLLVVQFSPSSDEIIPRPTAKNFPLAYDDPKP